MAGLAGVVGMAGCSGVGEGGSDGGEDEADEGDGENSGADRTETPTATATGTESPTETATETPVPAEIGFDFESADWAERWEIGDEKLVRISERAYSGEHSVAIQGDPADLIARAQPFEVVGSSGRQISRLSYYWQEAGGSFGGGLLLRNSNGSVELFTGSDNPQWVVATDTDPETLPVVYEGDGTERWIRTEVVFEWASGQALVRFTDLETETTREQEFELGEGMDVAAIELRPFTSARYEEGKGFRSANCAMAWDDIRIER